MIIYTFLTSARKRLFDTNRCLTSTNEMLVASRWPMRSVLFDSISFYASHGPIHTRAIKSQPANVISFLTNFRTKHFKSILVLRYATSSFPHSRSLLDFTFFAARCAEAQDVANEPTLLQAGKKRPTRDQNRACKCEQVREYRNFAERRFAMCLSEMRQENESLYDTHRRKHSMLFDFRQSSSSKADASFVGYPELLHSNETSKSKMLQNKVVKKSLTLQELFLILKKNCIVKYDLIVSDAHTRHI